MSPAIRRRARQIAHSASIGMHAETDVEKAVLYMLRTVAFTARGEAEFRSYAKKLAKEYDPKRGTAVDSKGRA